MRTALLLTLLSAYLFAQSPSFTRRTCQLWSRSSRLHIPEPAKDQRKMGKTVTRLKVSPEGLVTEVKTVSANAVFENYVLEALSSGDPALGKGTHS